MVWHDNVPQSGAGVAQIRAEPATGAGEDTAEVAMNVIVDLCVVPLGVGVSLSPYIAACERVIREAGLTAELHAYGTNIEGEWDQVFAAVKQCHATLHAMGVPRISTTLKLGTRSDRAQTMVEKLESVREKLAQDAPTAPPALRGTADVEAP